MKVLNIVFYIWTIWCYSLSVYFWVPRYTSKVQSIIWKIWIEENNGIYHWKLYINLKLLRTGKITRSMSLTCSELTDVGTLDVSRRFPSKISPTSPKYHIWPSRDVPNWLSDLTSWEHLETTSRGHPNMMSKGRPS